MFLKIAGFEFRYQLRQAIFWIGVIFFALLSFGSVASSNIQIGSNDNVHKNAPFALTESTLVFAVIFMFVITAFVANVIVRDDETGFGGILRTTPIRKFDYLYGRFLGAFLAGALAFAAVPVGLFLGSIAPWVDRETLGPFVLGHYLYAYFAIGLPILFLCSALFFALTTVTRSIMWTYVGLVGLLVLRTVFALVLSRPGYEHVAALWEPFGAGAVGEATRYWTASERNTLLPPLDGDLLANRALWMSVALAALAAAYWLFNFQARATRGRRLRRAEALAAEVEAGPAPSLEGVTLAKPVFDLKTSLAQLWARTRVDARQVFLSPAYFVLLGLAAALSVANLWFSTDIGAYGGKIYPVTRVMIDALNAAFTFFGIVIAVYYAGELVWRERERGTHEIVDATPVGDWAFILPKTLAIALVLISTLLVGVVVAIATQLVRGFVDIEPGKYLLWYVLPNAIDLTLLAALAIFIQAIVPHKFVGWAAMVVFLISTVVLSTLGFEHNLYQYGGYPSVPLSDMNGQGRYWIAAYWFRLYWSAFALILLIVAYGLWRRGTEARFLPRLRRLPRRLRGASGVLLAGAVLVFVASGVFIFYNTDILNTYRTTTGDERWGAEYEKRFLKYETLPQPKIARVWLDFQIHPHEPSVDAAGSYLIVNRTTAPIPALHLRFARDVEVRRLDVEGARLTSNFAGDNYRIYTFDRPLQPGETRSIAFATSFGERGFRNSHNILQIMDNGTFVNDGDLTPIIGMDRSMLLQDRAKRRKYGLPAELRMPKLGEPGADRFNFLRRDSDWVTADLTVSTDADQIPIAPGYQVSKSVIGGRVTARFVTESPILNFFSAQSARYAVSTVRYKGVDITVYYDPAHPWNVARIQKAMEAGLDYYDANYTPYQFHQIRVLEFPAPQGSFAESFANTIPWSEGIFFISDNRDPDRVDMVTYVGAHELGHQWWGHQVVGADEQGSTMLSETLAQYSALMVMKHMYGPDMMRKFLKFELDSYLRGRGGDVLEEEPLERVENQPYIHYRKGSLVMYRLQDAIGEDAVNRALRRLLHDYAFKGPPYPTSSELVADLRAEAPADEQQLITDLFEKITLYDVKAVKAVARKRGDGRYDVVLTIRARKVYANGHGEETDAPMNEVLQVGAFDTEPGQPGYKEGAVIALQRVAVHTGDQTVTLTVGRLPKYAGVDPFNMLIDRNSEDNIVKLSGG